MKMSNEKDAFYQTLYSDALGLTSLRAISHLFCPSQHCDSQHLVGYALVATDFTFAQLDS